MFILNLETNESNITDECMYAYTQIVYWEKQVLGYPYERVAVVVMNVP